MTNLLLSALPEILAASTSATSGLDASAFAALGAGIAIGLGSFGAAVGMGNAAGKALEASARQPELFGKIQTLLLTSIVFIESVCIYALVVALLLIFTF